MNNKSKTALITGASSGIGNETVGCFAKSHRMNPDKVVRAGLDALFHKKMSVIAAGLKDELLILSTRFAPRRFVAKTSKKFTDNP